MGLAELAAQTQQPFQQAQPQGNALTHAAGNQPQAAQGEPYNGAMTFQGHAIQVQNGVASANGKQINVSADGQVVWDPSTGIVLGSLDQQGNFTPTNAQHLQQLQKSGVVGNPQQAPQQGIPQGVPQ
jgi:preprotein translocase subunit SecD